MLEVAQLPSEPEYSSRKAAFSSTNSSYVSLLSILAICVTLWHFELVQFAQQLPLSEVMRLNLDDTSLKTALPVGFIIAQTNPE